MSPGHHTGDRNEVYHTYFADRRGVYVGSSFSYFDLTLYGRGRLSS